MRSRTSRGAPEVKIDILHYYDKLIALLPRKAEPVQVTKAHLRRGKILEQTGRWEECRQSYARALRTAQRAHSETLLGQAHNHLGQVLLLLGDYNGAQKHFEKASELAQAQNDVIGQARVYGNLGNLFFRLGQYSKAKDYYTHSIDAARRSDPAAVSAQTVAHFAFAYMNQGDYDNAVRIIQEQIPHSRRLNDKPGMTSLYTNLGIVYFEKGDYDAALDSYKQGMALSEELGNKMFTAINIGCFGSVYERRGDYPKAMQHFVRDLETSHPISLAAAIANIEVMKQDRIVEHAAAMGASLRRMLTDLGEAHPSVGEVRNIGLFGILELVKDRSTKEPMPPWNGSSPEMVALRKYCADHGWFLYTHWHTVLIIPPLIITEEELKEGMDILDKALEIQIKL